MARNLMTYPKKFLITILFSVLIGINISAKTAPLMAEIFLGMDATETSDTTRATTQPDPEPARAPLIDMKKIIGSDGESAIKIATIPGTSEILTAYPVKL